MADVVGLIVALAIGITVLAILVRALVFIARGYQENPILKLTLLACAFSLYPLWWHWASRNGSWEPTIWDLAPLWLPLLLLTAALVYVMFADRDRTDRFNSVAMAAFGFLIAAIILVIRAMQSINGFIYSSTDAGFDELIVAAAVGGVGTALGASGLLLILRKRWGTRGKLIAFSAIVMPPCIAFIVWTRLFVVCPPIAEGIELPASREDCSVSNWPNTYRGFIPGLLVDSAGIVVATETGEPLTGSAQLNAYLRSCAPRMFQRLADRNDKNSVLVPYDPLILRADHRVQFSIIEPVLKQMMSPEVRIWTVRVDLQHPDCACLCSATLFLDDVHGDGHTILITSDRGPNPTSSFSLDGREPKTLGSLRHELQALRRSQRREHMRINWTVGSNVTWGDFAVTIHGLRDITMDQSFVTSNN